MFELGIVLMIWVIWTTVWFVYFNESIKKLKKRVGKLEGKDV